MAKKVQRCARCDRRCRSGDSWAVALDLEAGSDCLRTASEIYCPDCTTAEEHTQKEVNDAGNFYIWSGDYVSMWPRAAFNY
jgi:hypothetical protein